MADVARVKADIKKRLMSEEWRQQFLTVALAKSAIDDLGAQDGVIMVDLFRRRLDEEAGRYLREKVDEKLSDLADSQINAAIADGQLSLDEYEKLI